MKQYNGQWQFTIRKPKTKVTKKDDKPYFEFGLPDDIMRTTALSLRYYMMIRGLGSEPSMVSTSLAEFKDVDLVKRLMMVPIRKTRPEPEIPNAQELLDDILENDEDDNASLPDLIADSENLHPAIAANPAVFAKKSLPNNGGDEEASPAKKIRY